MNTEQDTKSFTCNVHTKLAKMFAAARKHSMFYRVVFSLMKLLLVPLFRLRN